MAPRTFSLTIKSKAASISRALRADARKTLTRARRAPSSMLAR
jgi:hypothetical protein